MLGSIVFLAYLYCLGAGTSMPMGLAVPMVALVGIPANITLTLSPYLFYSVATSPESASPGTVIGYVFFFLIVLALAATAGFPWGFVAAVWDGLGHWLAS